MFPNSSVQLAGKENSIRRRKSGISGAGVKHRPNCLSTLSALHSHSSSSCVKKNRSLSLTMSKPIKSIAKKRQEKYVIQLGNQQIMQQFSKTGSSVVVKEGEDNDLQNLTFQQKIKVFFVLLMIPSAMFMFFGNNKFRSDSGHSIDPNIQLSHLGGMGGFPGSFPGRGFPGNGFDRGDGRRHAHNRMRRHYSPDDIHEHLNHLDSRMRNSEQNSRERNHQKNENKERTKRNFNERKSVPNNDINAHNLNEAKETETLDNLLNSDSVKQQIEKREENSEINENEIRDKNTNETNSTKPQTNSLSHNQIDPLIGGTESSGVMEEIGSEYKIIVLWTLFADFSLQHSGNQAFIDAKCVINKCFFTSNKSYSNQSDAIVFNARYLASHKLPNKRSLHQKWIFFSRDSPQYNVAQDFNSMSNLFNWSWTYRLDSDIVYNNGNVEHMSIETNENFKDSDVFDVWRRKSKMILWFANNCQTKSKREIYINQLKSYVDIDAYGQCSNSSNDINIANETQLKTLSEKYLFVIVFEKDFCKDLVHKRLYKYLEHNIVPIVMSGLKDYSPIVPPNSVINANEFNSAKELADYVIDIGTDFQKYKKYFEWKSNYRITYDRKDLCHLCYKLHEEVNKVKKIEDFNKWWFDSADCHHWDLSIKPLL